MSPALRRRHGRTFGKICNYFCSAAPDSQPGRLKTLPENQSEYTDVPSKTITGIAPDQKRFFWNLIITSLKLAGALMMASSDVSGN